jgi:hypothetical protein
LEITLSYRQLAAISIVIGVIAAGIGVVKVNELTGSVESSSEHVSSLAQSSQVEASQSSLPDNQESVTDQQFLAIKAEIESLRKDLAIIKSEATSKNEPGNVLAAEGRIASLEKKVSDLAKFTKPADDSALAKEVQELHELLNRAEATMEQMQHEIETLKEQIAAMQQETEKETQAPSEQESTPGEVSEQQPTDFTVKSLTASTNRVEYKLGDVVVISGKTDPNVPVAIQVIHEKNNVVFNTTINSDPAGVYRIEYKVQTDAPMGWYNAKVSSGDKGSTLVFRVIDTHKISAKSESGTVTIGVVSTSYSRGDYISVTGEAPPKSKVILTITPASGNESSATVWTDSDGKYQKLFQLTLDASAGDWTISAKYNSETASLKVKVL